MWLQLCALELADGSSNMLGISWNRDSALTFLLLVASMYSLGHFLLSFKSCLQQDQQGLPYFKLKTPQTLLALIYTFLFL
jgi:hypothetical protein